MKIDRDKFAIFNVDTRYDTISVWAPGGLKATREFFDYFSRYLCTKIHHIFFPNFLQNFVKNLRVKGLNILKKNCCY